MTLSIAFGLPAPRKTGISVRGSKHLPKIGKCNSGRRLIRDLPSHRNRSSNGKEENMIRNLSPATFPNQSHRSPGTGQNEHTPIEGAGVISAWPRSGNGTGEEASHPKRKPGKPNGFESIDDESGTLARTIRPGHDLPADEYRDGPVPFGG